MTPIPIDILRAAIDVFHDEEVARDWLALENLSLGDRRPQDLLSTSDGRRTVLQVLNAIATGGPAGRFA